MDRRGRDIDKRGHESKNVCHQGPCWRHRAPRLTHVRGQGMRNAYDDRCEKQRGVPALSGTPINPRASRYNTPMTPILAGENKDRRTKANYFESLAAMQSTFVQERERFKDRGEKFDFISDPSVCRQNFFGIYILSFQNRPIDKSRHDRHASPVADTRAPRRFFFPQTISSFRYSTHAFSSPAP